MIKEGTRHRGGAASFYEGTFRDRHEVPSFNTFT